MITGVFARVSWPWQGYNALPEGDRMRIVSAFVVILAASISTCAQPESCNGFNSLLGDWTGTGAGTPGQGTGGFSFKMDLQGHIMVRRNFAEYPAREGKPASRHHDLMVLYNDPAGGRHADYWDSEGHVIRYVVSVAADGCTITFESARSERAPAYKLTYTIHSSDEVAIAFQVAPPGKDFGAYIEASAKRKH